MYPPLCRRALGACLIRLGFEILGFLVLYLGGSRGCAISHKCPPHKFFGIFLDVWFDMFSRYRFLLVSELFLAGLRD